MMDCYKKRKKFANEPRQRTEDNDRDLGQSLPVHQAYNQWNNSPHLYHYHNLFKSCRPLIDCLCKKPVVADTSTRDGHLKRLLHSHSALMMRKNQTWFSKLFFLSLIPLKEWTLFVMIFTQSMTSGYLLFPEERVTNASHSASKAFVNLRL